VSWKFLYYIQEMKKSLIKYQDLFSFVGVFTLMAGIIPLKDYYKGLGHEFLFSESFILFNYYELIMYSISLVSLTLSTAGWFLSKKEQKNKNK
jgi:hypothetical protein